MVPAYNRFTRNNPCPICGGWGSMERGSGHRCFGFYSEDRKYAHCTREEKSGGIEIDSGETYAHFMQGKCKCGETHGTAPLNPRPNKPAPVIDLATRKPQIAVEYSYEDENRKLLFQAVRLEPKDFKQRQPDSKGGWIWNLQGVRRVLYRLPELLEADPDLIVFLVEGEKDVETLRGFGAVATCNPMGAKKWLPTYNSFLKNRFVVILPDNDKDGREHAQMLATSLKGTAASIKIIELDGLPDKGDVSDWLKTHKVEELETLINQTQEWNTKPEQTATTTTRKAPAIISASELLKKHFEPIRWIIPQILPEGATMLAARPKMGKSWLALNWAIAVATGGVALSKLRCEQGEVLYLALEDNERRLKSRLQTLIDEGVNLDKLYFATDWARVGAECIMDLEAWLKEHPDTRLVIVDTLAKIRPPKDRDQGIYEADYNALTGLKKLSDTYHVAILIIHHNRKGGSEDAMEEISGSFGLTAAIDNAYTLRRNRGEADAVLNVMGRDIEDAELALHWQADLCLWELMGPAQEYTLNQERKSIVDLLRKNPRGMKIKEISEELDRKYENTKKTLQRMFEAGQVDHIDGKYTIGQMPT